MKSYITKPVLVTAIQFTQDNEKEIIEILRSKGMPYYIHSKNTAEVKILLSDPANPNERSIKLLDYLVFNKNNSVSIYTESKFKESFDCIESEARSFSIRALKTYDIEKECINCANRTQSLTACGDCHDHSFFSPIYTKEEFRNGSI